MMNAGRALVGEAGAIVGVRVAAAVGVTVCAGVAMGFAVGAGASAIAGTAVGATGGTAVGGTVGASVGAGAVVAIAAAAGTVVGATGTSITGLGAVTWAAPPHAPKSTPMTRSPAKDFIASVVLRASFEDVVTFIVDLRRHLTRFDRVGPNVGRGRTTPNGRARVDGVIHPPVAPGIGTTSRRGCE